MDSRIVRNRKTSCVLAVWAVALITISGCTSVATVVEPPIAPNGMIGMILHASPEDIALKRSDLPAGFQLAAEKTLGPEYVALYLRPSALDPEASGGNTLLSVLTSVGVYTTTTHAESVYLEAAADPIEQAIEDVGLVSGAATDIVTEKFEGAAQGADASEAYRVSYRLMDQLVFEYGHRLRLGNVLVYVVVAAIGNPDEPQHLLEDARDIVQRQIDHIAGASEKPINSTGTSPMQPLLVAMDDRTADSPLQVVALRSCYSSSGLHSRNRPQIRVWTHHPIES